MARTLLQWFEDETRPADGGGDDVRTSLGELVIDAVTAQTRDHQADLPDHPVEDGVSVTDQVTPQPGRVSFEAHISSAIFDDLILGDRRTVSAGGVDVRVISEDNPADRAADALATLQRLTDNGTEVDIIGLPYGDLEGYQLISISATQSEGTGAKLVPTIEARQRVTASVSEVDAPAPRVERTRPARNRGAQPATPPADETRRERAESAAHALTSLVGL